MGESEKAGEERVERATERFVEHLEEEKEENGKKKEKKAKTEEITSRSNQVATSSSEGGVPEIPRSRGQVPLEITRKGKADEDQQDQPEEKLGVSRTSVE